MSDYLEISHLLDKILYWNWFLDMCVGHLATIQAAHMIMVTGVAVETLLRARDLNFLYDTIPGQKLEVSVDSTHTDTGESASNHSIQLVGARVGSETAELLEYNIALFSFPQF